MTGYTAIPNGDIDQDSPVTQPLMQLLRDNPLAIAESDSTAPVNQAAWHPYNKVTNGDANDGKFYDFAVSGAVASVETPVFDAGYDYRVRLSSISHNNGTATDFRVEMRRQSSGLYNPAANLVTGVPNTFFGSGFVDMTGTGQTNMNYFGFPMVFSAVTGVNASLSAATFQIVRFEVAVNQRLDRARLSWAAGSIDNGVMYLDRRRAIS